ncbi:MAG: hypothetical protein ACW99A_23160 [Candidatus Kariarchaeaceae archaeon]
MGISKTTTDVLSENTNLFSEPIRESINTIIEIAAEYSPISDLNYLVKKVNRKICGIEIEGVENSWVPIRNVIRIIAKIGEMTKLEDGEITEIQINSMSIGCDYFEGHLTYTTTNKMNMGKYKWQWTAFPGFERNYNKFTSFPNNWIDIPMKKESVPA